jgi:hypothetical protein
MSTMRPARAFATGLLIASVALAGCGTRDAGPSAPPAAPPTVAPTTPAPVQPTQPPVGRPPGTAQAVATAVSFLRREVGMADPVAGPFRWTGARTGQVEVRARIPDDVNPLRGPVSVVTLQRLTSAWYVLGVRTQAIAVTAPRPRDPIRSPVTVMATLGGTGQDRVQVRVTQDRYGKDLELGRGDLARTSPSPNLGGAIGFRPPSGSTGSVVLTTASGRNGEVWAATVVRVGFAAGQAPWIQSVTAVPKLVERDGWLQLPAVVTFQVTATGADRARLVYTTTGTETAWGAQVVAQDTSPANGLRLAWRPGDAWGYLRVDVLGPGGTTSREIGQVQSS